MVETLALACRCGALRGRISGAGAEGGTHLICYCKDCRAFAERLGQAERILDAQGGTRLYQLLPEQVSIETGRAHLACLRLTSKGIYRWYASCCDTPLANTLGTPKFAFAGVLAANIAGASEALGPVIARVHTGSASGAVTEPKGNFVRVALRIFWRAAKARIDGSWRQTPFFDPTSGRAVAKPHVLAPPS